MNYTADLSAYWHFAHTCITPLDEQHSPAVVLTCSILKLAHLALAVVLMLPYKKHEQYCQC